MTLATIVLTLLALPAAFIVWSARSLVSNQAKAEQAGFPILVRWVTPTNPLWMIFGSTIVRKCRALNIGTENFWTYYVFGWEANQRHLAHQKYGEVFMLVTPGGNWLCVNDAEVIYDVLRRRTEFTRNLVQFDVLNVYGTNLSTTEGVDWQKHRKVTAVTFTEKNNELVWKQSLAQAKGMLEYWTERAPQPLRTIGEDTKVFTLNVLAAALFDKMYPFEGASEPKASHVKDDSYTYRDSLNRILKNIIPLFIFGGPGLQAWWTPKSWKQAGEAVTIFRTYVTGLIAEERSLMARGIQDNRNLVATLVRACEKEEQEINAIPLAKRQGSDRKMTLTEQEIISNLFVFAFAGNDTTAIVMTHIVVDMTAHPEIQEWIAEEIHHYLPSANTSEWAFDTYPKLKRCLAVVMESLRLNHPLGQLAKTTENRSPTITIASKAYTLPPDTSVHLSLSALHTHSRYWGADSMTWNPKRFISYSANAPKTIENEVLAADTSEHYLAWAWGQRVCPGKKFSQVELVATLATLFYKHTVQPELREGETLEQARKRVYQAGLDIEHEGKILHEMREPESTCLVWKERKG
ncbi:cytochrome P450 monooxygenase-like protein [Massariosphaeria phaeospora]|uniref:Cytochrome P450 monooxygenase-like protein n=1 Tax=Massariosphaeria phaeospora TaxID=100035 RepID=A0A7C8MDM7_9PLEO|nr:cytochrome P450 monooxygenase-like protein [Massariosphaeria phaeospora]